MHNVEVIFISSFVPNPKKKNKQPLHILVVDRLLQNTGGKAPSADIKNA
jgi:hypothetical protein